MAATKVTCRTVTLKLNLLGLFFTGLFFFSGLQNSINGRLDWKNLLMSSKIAYYLWQFRSHHLLQKKLEEFSIFLLSSSVVVAFFHTRYVVTDFYSSWRHVTFCFVGTILTKREIGFYQKYLEDNKNKRRSLSLWNLRTSDQAYFFFLQKIPIKVA